MFERFTDRARAVVVSAQDEARELKHNYIGTEHLLLGLLHERAGVAAKALASLGITATAVREQIDEIVGYGEQDPKGHIPFTPRAKKVLNLALREALQLKHNYIGTEHILLGLIREGEGVAAQVLTKLGAELTRARRVVVDMLDGGSADPVTPRSPAVMEALSRAEQLAGGSPLASHHLLAALAGTEGSMAARILAELGVDAESIAAKGGELDLDQTTDATPELIAAAKMELRVVGDEVHIVFRDEETLRAARAITDESAGTLTAQHPLVSAFFPLWRTVHDTLSRLERTLSGDETPDEHDSLLKRALHARRRKHRDR